jgi:diacylglycerol kinase
MARLISPRARLRGNGDGAGEQDRLRRPLGRSPSILESFNFAFEGIIHVLRTHRNMRVHFAVAIIVLVAAVWVGVSKLELIALLLAIAFVFITEMVNSALEQAIDVATTSFDPLAKLAKGRCRRRCPDRDGERGRDRLPRLLGRGFRPEHSPARPAA